ncbi:MAG: hypothetical protein L3J59_12910 [Methylococcaceae bacterium]|nr:hypothetical protein [Methylococcaceae bacterium]
MKSAVVEEGKAGLVTVNGEDDVLLENALKLLYDEGFRMEMGENSKILMLEAFFSVETAIGKILGFFWRK